MMFSLSSKILTTVVSTFTAYYLHLWSTFVPSKPLTPPLPSFDGRVVLYPSTRTMRDYMSWRQVDCKLYFICFLPAFPWLSCTETENRPYKQPLQHYVLGSGTARRNGCYGGGGEAEGMIYNYYKWMEVHRELRAGHFSRRQERDPVLTIRHKLQQ